MSTPDETTPGETEVGGPAAHALGPGLQPAQRLGMPPVPQRPEARWIDLSEIAGATPHRLREVEAVAPLAESIARHGQREPVELRRTAEGLELVSGHRRLAAVRVLHRGRILGRVHEGLSDEDALLLALADDLDRRPWSAAEREGLAARLEDEGRLTPRLQSLLNRAAAQAPVEAPPPPPEDAGEEEIEIEELASRVRDRLADAANDLATLFEVWGDLDEGRRDDLVECVRYLKDMYPFLSQEDEEEG